jgi:ribosome-associated protein
MDDDDHQQPSEERASKTRMKREMHALQDIGEALVELPEARLAELDLPERLRDAVLDARRISKFGALRRQLQYIGRLMRDVDSTVIRERLEAWRGQSRHAAAHLHALERWRERLLADDEALEALIASHPETDIQRVRALVRNARREQALGKPPASFRELFQELKTIIPEHHHASSTADATQTASDPSELA